jgi:hypothetical protein
VVARTSGETVDTFSSGSGLVTGIDATVVYTSVVVAVVTGCSVVVGEIILLNVGEEGSGLGVGATDAGGIEAERKREEGVKYMQLQPVMC